jgi:CheY-like chemotaxis protein
LNLLSNAIKFTERGAVSLTFGATVYRDDEMMLMFAVRDTGIGIPAERIHSLFAPFIQADTSTTRRFGGTGLGLSISKRLAQAMGGSIEVDSALGHGSTFRFAARLRLGVASVGESANQLAAPAALGLSGMQILLAEDNPVNQKLAVRLLQKLGANVRVVNNGIEVLQALREADFDAVLMDCQMPLMDGYEATQQLRRAEGSVRNAQIPVIALTAHAMATDRAKCLAAGMNDYLTKPINPAHLRQALTKVLPPRKYEKPVAAHRDSLAS